MALTKQQNERLTQIGPGTPMGNLLRRYWQPVGTAPELEKEPVQKVRIMGEDLILFRTWEREYGLMGDRCPHRCMSMEYGIPQEHGLRCAYHGWQFDLSGKCIAQPYDDTINPDSRFKDKVRIKAYPVQEMSGLLFAYMGPEPAPLLPRWDVLVRDDLDAVVDIHELPCNWLQCMDNSVDPIHFEHLHAAFGNYVLQKMGREPAMTEARHLKIAFDPFRYGIVKRRLLEGEPETIDDWQIGHPLLFPNILAVGQADWPMLHYRVPIDDEHTLQFMYRTLKRTEGAAPKPLSVRRGQIYNEQGKIVADHIPPQDMLAFVAQGPIMDRTQEHLGASDVGVIMYHKMLFEEMDKVERGEDPLGIIRDPAENEPMVNLRREGEGYHAFDSRYESYEEKVRQLATARAD